MSRPSLPSVPVDGLPYDKLHAVATELGSVDPESQPPTYWFELTVRSAEQARNEERRGSKAGQYVAYTRLAIAYQKCMFHKRFKDARAADHAWAIRVTDFKSTYESAMHKAKVLKEELKAAPVKTHQSTNSVDHEHGGSIADRMKALSGHGVDVSTKRMSRELGPRPAPPSRQQHPARRPSQDLTHQRRPSLPRPPSISNLPSNLSRRGSSASLSGMNGISPNPTGGSTRSNYSPVKNSVPLYRPSSAMSTASARQIHASGSVPPSPAAIVPSLPTAPSEPPTPPIQPPAPRTQPPAPRTQPSAPVTQPPTTPSWTATSSPPRTAPVEPEKAPERPSSVSASQRPPQLPLAPPVSTSLTSSPTDAAERLGNFEKAFPSLDELGKQFDDEGFAIPSLPASASNGPRPVPEAPKKTDDDAAAFPGFPSLPSVPTDLPGTRAPPKPPLPPPPAPPRLDDLKKNGDRPPSPPNTDSLRQDRSSGSLSFPTQNSLALSTFNSPHASIFDDGAKLKSPLQTLGQQDEVYAASPVSSAHIPEGVSSSSPVNGSAFLSSLDPLEAAAAHVTSPPTDALSLQPLAMPTPQAAPVARAGNNPVSEPPGATQSSAVAPSTTAPEKIAKPNFPYTSSITPDTLRGYFTNPAADVLICDVRPAEEFAVGFVGAEYHERGCKVSVVWIDPTVLMRPGLTSTQLEGALSLSPEAQQVAFASRNLYDLVVIVDSRSRKFPGKGEAQTPAGNLRNVIYEHEFAKVLPRSPALLLGGYEAWVEFIKSRQRINLKRIQEEQASFMPRMPPNGAPNGHASPLSPRPANASPQVPERRAGHAREKSYQMSPSHYSKEITENFAHGSPQSMTGGPHSQHHYSASYSGGPASYMPYQQAPAARSPMPVPMPRASHASSNSISSNLSSLQGYNMLSHNRTDSFSNYSVSTGIAPPPRASVHTSAMTRRQSSSDYMDYGSPRQQTRIEYPQAHGLVRVPQPPPAAASHGLERQDQRAPMPTRLPQWTESVADSGVHYWRDTRLGLTGLKNLGNTCYMNSTVQCLSATFPFARYFLNEIYKRDLNETSNLGTKGRMAKAFADLLMALWSEKWKFLSPITFRQSIISFNDLFAGNEQHDSQEFLSFMLDGLHEDLNRVKHKPQIEMTPHREKALEELTPQEASDKEWALYRQRDDSIIVDLFQGQYRSRTTCLTCRKTSTVYDSFMWLTLDLPAQNKPVLLSQLIDRWVSAETLSIEDGWHCAHCKAPRKATKALTLVRLPPVLLIQLKRFSFAGRHWNRSDTPVIFPTTNLDLTRFVPRREPTGAENLDDPRTQIGPFKYELYGVTNHSGTLSSGHYTAFVRDAGGWTFAEDSQISKASETDVISHPAASYILFYKRVQAS
ncbi:hypothetical protein CC85DRAFT_288603 [Cutaneotrichosporon oleaginosum]|uniref:ubiquitinyl hydrolase 1 n=1 Tax=Cutaneotrichosporon oleaginosum TaxID=879819 RepID=A0A0J0XE24_9TREE|nr:uncharacterized protein CC85DRAFT_288603 [Cutaneotrichosporon oleaginosum]KLT39351.1 hypothetical protein CC85DRAFT_288603 [Cutaneotrichosporon oleaginosum]TXT12102.1 hypothetical protein COLE_02512 [Cutaneotrichosporon oleaginosum]